jgi:hypothetical protein
MSLKADVTVDAAKFDRSEIDTQTLEFNQKLIKIWADGPRWYEVCFPSPLHLQSPSITSFLFSSFPIFILPPQPLLSHTLLSPSDTSHADYYDRSEQQPTAKCAGKAKHPCPNP